jgi:DNA replication protein DnaC
MERLSDSMRCLGRQQEQQMRSISHRNAYSKPLPVGPFLREEDEEESHQVQEQRGTASHQETRKPRSIERTRSRLRRQGEIRVVESEPPGKPSSHQQAAVPLPSIELPSPVMDQPICPLCKGAGYLRANVPVGHQLFGKAQPCACKLARVNEERRRLLREQSQIDRLAAFREALFETFQFLLPGVQEAYEAALQFAHEPQGWLILEGDNGCGKTHLAISIAKHCLNDGAIVLFAVVPDLLDYLRATFAPNAEEPYDEAFLKMREAELLVLDDLGAEHSTPWANEKLFQLLNYRYNGRLATVITTNKIGLAGIENRIRSRLSDKRLVRVVTMGEAQDFRTYAEPTERADENM